jgi:hypothetical protein
MAFYINGNRLPEGISFYDANGTQYPSGWLNQSTEEQKAAIGITWVADLVRADDRFYWDGDINNPKDLDQVKAMAVSQVNAAAYSILLQSDWMVVKSIETSTPVDSAWSIWRASIRTSASIAVTAINAAIDVDAVATALQVTWAQDPNNAI